MISKELQIWRAWEYLVLSDLLQHWIQCYETAQWVEYDIVADIDWKLVRIQVKTTSKMVIRWKKSKTPVYHFHTKRAGKWWNRLYKDNAFDYYALVCIEDKKIMYMKFEQDFNSISIRPRDSDFIERWNFGFKKSSYDDEYTFEKFINNI